MTLMLGLGALAQDEEKKPIKIPRRFGFDVDEVTYPQKSAKEALHSVVKAIDGKRVDYMLAHLIDPAYVDYWVDRYKASFASGRDDAKALLAFDRLVRETTDYFQADPKMLRELRAFNREAQWMEAEDAAAGTVASIPARKVFVRKVGERWFLENRQEGK